MASLISPELALVDPLLRTDALAALPHVEPFDFLRFREPAPAAVHTRRPPLALAAVVFTLPVSDGLAFPKGTMHPGMFASLTDARLPAAVKSTLPPGMFCTTAEVSTTFLAPASRGDELRAQAKMIHADGATGLSEATVTRGDGRLVGHATSRVFVFPPVELDDAGPVLQAEAQ